MWAERQGGRGTGRSLEYLKNESDQHDHYHLFKSSLQTNKQTNLAVPVKALQKGHLFELEWEKLCVFK